ncbi:unnamed protein product [marine sediment metagenome]|uniref:Uncharacterized protein n=1 Tax=marine sediment metagenome TaxID=412755 RepID=X1Q5M7_9ZZZZ
MKPIINLKAAKKSMQDLNLREDFITQIISGCKTINGMSEEDYKNSVLSVRVYCDTNDDWSTDKLGHIINFKHSEIKK